jgi:hypothetical protein
MLNNSAKFEYDPKERTIYFDPHSGLQFSNGDIQSPAIGFAHEVDHAARHEEDPKQYAADSAWTQKSTGLEIEMSKNVADEAKATRFERQVAKAVNERGRKRYKEETKPVEVPSPTTHRYGGCTTTGASCHSGTSLQIWN